MRSHNQTLFTGPSVSLTDVRKGETMEGERLGSSRAFGPSPPPPLRNVEFARNMEYKLSRGFRGALVAKCLRKERKFGNNERSGDGVCSFPKCMQTVATC